MRKFHILAINKYHKEKKEEYEKQEKKHSGDSNQVFGPNISQPSTYNFRK